MHSSLEMITIKDIIYASITFILHNISVGDEQHTYDHLDNDKSTTISNDYHYDFERHLKRIAYMHQKEIHRQL